MEQLAKIHRHRWKERLKNNKVGKFESDRLKTNEDMHPQSRKILDGCMGGGGGGARLCLPPYKRL